MASRMGGVLNWMGYEAPDETAEQSADRIAQLEAEIARLNQQPVDLSTLPADVVDELASQAAVVILRTAHQREAEARATAERTMAEAQQAANRVLAEAEARTTEMLAKAESTARDIIARAEPSARALTAEAEAAAAATIDAASRRAQELETWITRTITSTEQKFSSHAAPLAELLRTLTTGSEALTVLTRDLRSFELPPLETESVTSS